MSRRTLSILACLGLFAALPLTGCASRTQSLDTATAGVADTRAQLTAGADQVDAVMASLKGFTNTPDMAVAFKQYNDEVKEMESVAEKVRARRAAMQTRVQDHVDKWQAELANIQGEQARQISSDRQARFVESLKQLGAAMDALKADYEPFISNLHDIQLVLANDLSVGGLKVAQPLITDAAKQAEEVKASINTANAKLGEAVAEFQR